MVLQWYMLVYYVLHLLLEEEFFAAVRRGGFRVLWRDSKLLSAEFVVLYYPGLLYFLLFAFPSAAAEIRDHCISVPRCRQYLWDLPPLLPWAGSPAETGDLTWVDSADIQWRDFRGSLLLLCLAAALLSGLVRGALTFTKGWARYIEICVAARWLVGAGFLLYIHGAGSLFLLCLLSGLFCLARLIAGTRLAVPLAWSAAVLAIAAKEPRWPVRRHLTFFGMFGQRVAFLDARSFQGEYDWAESVNLLVLRLLSFTLDCHQAALRRGSKVVVRGGEEEGEPVVQRPYAFPQCAAHALYAPLWLAGPTIRYDDFYDQCIGRTRSTKTKLGWYLVQLLVAVTFLESGTRRLPVFAMARSGEFGRLGPRLGACAAFFTLNIMWLKFTVVWRIARAWALADGIDPPENMRRALCHHYSVAGFWQSWHVSFNRWLVAYIYVPVGGRRRRVLATTLVFSFVAYWHDVEPKLMAWGLLNSLFIALEFGAVALAARWTAAAGLPTRRPWLYRQLCAFGGATCVILLIGVNMIGYSVGLVGISSYLTTTADFRWEALCTLLGTYWWFFILVQVMFEIRHIDGTYAREALKAGAAASAPVYAAGACCGAAADCSGSAEAKVD